MTDIVVAHLSVDALARNAAPPVEVAHLSIDALTQSAAPPVEVAHLSIDVLVPYHETLIARTQQATLLVCT